MATKVKKESKVKKEDDVHTISVNIDGNKNQMTVPKVDPAFCKDLAKKSGIGKFKIWINGEKMTSPDQFPDLKDIKSLEIKSIDEAAV